MCGCIYIVKYVNHFWSVWSVWSDISLWNVMFNGGKFSWLSLLAPQQHVNYTI